MVISPASGAHGYCQTPARLRGHLFWLLGRASHAAQQLTQDQIAAAGLRRGYYGVLATLDEFGPAAQAEIGRRLRLDPSDMVAILNEMEGKGYISRVQDPADRRRNRVTATAAGLAALDGFDRAITQVEDELLAALRPAERAQLTALLERLVSAPDQAASGASR